MDSFPSSKSRNPTFLIINSVSENCPPLKVSEEAQKIVDAVGAKRCRLFPAVPASALWKPICEHGDAEFVHISTHGGDTVDGVPVLHMLGDAVAVPELVRLFKQTNVSPMCLVLMGCDGIGIAKDLLANHATLQYVLCTDRPVFDDLCVMLSGEFYQALKSFTIEEAFKQALANVERYIKKGLPAVLKDESMLSRHEDANSYKVWKNNREKNETLLRNLEGFRLQRRQDDTLDSSGISNQSCERSFSSATPAPLDVTFAASTDSSMSRWGSFGSPTPARGDDSYASAQVAGRDTSFESPFRIDSPAVRAAPALEAVTAEAATFAPTGDGAPGAATQARVPGWTDCRILEWAPPVGVGGETITLNFGLEIESEYGLAPTTEYKVYFDKVETPWYYKRKSVFVTCEVPPPPGRLQDTSSIVVYLSIKNNRTGEEITLDSTDARVPFTYLAPENLEMVAMARAVSFPSSPRHPVAKTPPPRTPPPRSSAQRTLSFRDEPPAAPTRAGRDMAALAYLCFHLSFTPDMEHADVCLRTDSQESADLVLLHRLRTEGCVDRSGDLLFWCCTCDLVKTALYLLSRGADVMRQPFVSIALRHNSRRVVSALLRYGAPVSAKECLQNDTLMLRPHGVPVLSWLDLPKVKRPRLLVDKSRETVAMPVGCPVVTFDPAEPPPATATEPTDADGSGSLSSSEVSEGVVNSTKTRSNSLVPGERGHARDMLRSRAHSDTPRSPRKICEAASEPQAGLDDISSTASFTSGGTVSKSGSPASSLASSPSSSATASLAGSPPRENRMGPTELPLAPPGLQRDALIPSCWRP